MFDTGIYQADIIRETEKAILVPVPANRFYAAREVWLPKSQVQYEVVQSCFGPSVFVQPWLAREHRLYGAGR